MKKLFFNIRKVVLYNICKVVSFAYFRINAIND